jgi:glycosyltransferase involved in cell wall biosynthesis
LAAAQYRHKNLATAVDGFRRVRESRPDARLVLVGQVPDGLGESKVSAPLPVVDGVVQLGFVPDAVLAWLYRRATAVLLPSLYEGCGLPVAEALPRPDEDTVRAVRRTHDVRSVGERYWGVLRAARAASGRGRRSG